jgi:hypothetical protein
MNLAFEVSLFILRSDFKCFKVLRHWATALLPPKKGVLLIYIALKNPSPQPDLNPQTLGKRSIVIRLSKGKCMLYQQY